MKRKKIIVNNSNNINKTNNQLSSERTNKKTMTYDVGNPGTGLGQVQKCGRIKLVNGIPTLPFLIIVYACDQ